VRILHIIESMQIGGAERHLANLLAPLRALGVQNEVALLWSGQAFDDSVRPFAEVHDFALPPRKVMPALPRLVALARQADVVHTQLPWADIAGRLAALAARRPSVTTLQSTWYDSHNTSSFDRRLRRRIEVVKRLDGWTARATSRFFAVSEATKRTYVRELRLRPERIDIIPNSVDLRRFDPGAAGDREAARRALGLGDEIAILMLARLVRPKGHVEAIKAVSQIRERPLVLLIAGTGPDEESLRELAASLKAPVRFLGPRSDAPQLLRAADIFLFPSQYEGLPLALIEAMAMQVPCLCSDIPENRETGGEHVAYAPAGEVAPLIAGLRTLAADPQRRAQLAQGARISVSRFSATTIAERLLASIEEVLRATRGGHVVAT
jgi:glycosyltransferase involved in cell wall biosynthesis